MLVRCTAERPQRVLEPLGERDIALTAEDNVGMFEARTGKPEVVEPVIEQRAGDGDAKVGHVGEVRQPHPAGFMNLAEDDLLFRAIKCAP